jgi:hypothetical protein
MASNPTRLDDTSLKPPNFSFACTGRLYAILQSDPARMQTDKICASVGHSRTLWLTRGDGWGLQLAPRDTKARDLLTSALAERRADHLPSTNHKPITLTVRSTAACERRPNFIFSNLGPFFFSLLDNAVRNVEDTCEGSVAKK